MWAAGCIVLATPLPMVATRTALVAHTPRFFFFFFKYMPRQRAGRRPPWAQIASLARPEPWRSGSISPRDATKSWAITHFAGPWPPPWPPPSASNTALRFCRL